MLQTYGGFERIEQGVLLYLEQSSRQSYSRQATHCLEHPSFPHSPFVLHSPAKWQSFPKWCSPGAIVLFVRISLETLSGDLPIFFAISLSFNFWYMPHSITILSANVKRLIFSCFPQTVTVCIIPYPPPTLTERWWKCFAFSPKATETQKYLFIFRLRNTHCSIFINNPSRSCQLHWWRLPQALKILKYLYILFLFVKVNFGYFSFFTLKIRTSLWQFRGCLVTV